MTWNTNPSRSMWSLTCLALAVVSASTLPADGQSAPSVHVGAAEIKGLPDDWTHHHVLFSNPGTEQEASQSGRHERWQKIVTDPRYVIQQMKSGLPVQGPAAVDADFRAQWIAAYSGIRRASAAPEEREPSFGFEPRRPKPTPNPSKSQRDWSMTSGGTGGLAAGHYPAKYQFGPGPTNVESCTDYVAFPTGIQGSTTQATLVAYNNIYKATCAGSVPGILLSINTGGLAKTSPVLSIDGTQAAYMQTTATVSLVAKTTFLSTSFTLVAGTLTASDVGAPVSGPALPAGDTIATVVNATTGTLSKAATSSVAKTPFTIASLGQLVLLKIGAGGGTAVSSPLSPTAVTAANYRTCTGPCYTTLTLSGNTADSNSAPFYVYADTTNGSPDLLYVGDDNGSVHKFTNVFLSGTPAEVTTKWPVTASTETAPALSSPVYDSISGNIFVGDASGYLHQFAAATPGTVNTSGQLAHNTGGLDAPIVDNTGGTDTVYAFIGYSGDPGNNYPSYINAFPAATSVSGGTTYGSIGVPFPNNSTSTRPASSSTMMYTGTFDNTYFNGSGTTGNIYACADGVLYQIPLATISTPVVNTFSTPTSAASTCSPVTEFYNSASSSDFLFMSVSGSAIASGGSACTGACVLNYIAPTSASTHTGTPAAGLPATGGTSGIVIDNSGPGGGSEIYFTSIGSESCAGNGTTGSGTGSCAVQATQSGLQ